MDWELDLFKTSVSRLVLPLQQNTFAISDMSLASHHISMHKVFLLLR